MALTTNDNEILLELKQHKIDILYAISQLKQKNKGSVKVPGYVLIYSGAPKDERAIAGVGLIISQNIRYINERILTITLNIGSEKLHLISV